MDAEEFKFRKDNRKYLRTKVTKFINNISPQISTFSIQECRDAAYQITQFRSRLEKHNLEISSSIWKYEKDRTKLNEEMEGCDEYDAKLAEMSRQVEDRVTSAQSNSSSNPSVPDSMRITNQIKLPQLPLPEYNHAPGEDLNKFFSNFESIMDKYNLSSYERFVFLTKQLGGEAATLVRSLQGDSQSYLEAKNLLVEAFASPTTQRFDILARLSKLSLAPSGNCYTFVSEFRTLISTVRNLKIDVDTVLQFFIWKAMPYGLQNQFITITNNNHPSLDEIDSNIFSAIERFQNIQKRFEKKNVNSATGLAANVNIENKPKFKSCVLCSSDKVFADHQISKCSKYDSPGSKIDRLKVLKACLKCANTSHTTDDCRFKFYKSCFFCSGTHFSFICPKTNVKNSNKVETPTAIKHKSNLKSNSVSTGVVSINCNALDSQSNYSTILPTFTTYVDGTSIHGLKDTGSQCSFILSELAENLNLKVLSDVSIIVNGFNCSKPYDTKLYELKLDLCDKICTIAVIGVPQITTCLKLAGLNDIVQGFIDKGYILADKTLLNLNPDEVISEISLILGADYSHCLPENPVLFGTGNSSCFSESPLGIVLMGNMNDLKLNLKFLKPLTVINTSIIELEPGECSDNIVTSEERLVLESESVARNSVVTKSEKFPSDESDTMSDSNADSALEKLSNGDSVDFLEQKCNDCLNYDNSSVDEVSTIDDEVSTKFILDNIDRDPSGRLIMPILWDDRNVHLLSKNFNLSKKILMSNLKKLNKQPERLKMIDAVFKEQLDAGVIEKIQDLDEFLETNPESSFLAHMPIFKLNRETTKTRVVYMSNLGEPGSNHLSHNQTIKAGPLLNKKLSTALMQARFDKKLLCFDLVKAFLQIALPISDRNRLCFLWFENVEDGNFNVVGFRSARLSFGLRCSPSILMLALYHILIQDVNDDPPGLVELKRKLYDLIYMDNGSITGNSEEEIDFAYESLAKIFGAYKFEVQDIITNDHAVSAKIKNVLGEDVPIKSKLLGMNWDRVSDELSCCDLFLDPSSVTKRSILSSIAANFDLFGFNIPILNRARLFLHDLQIRKDLAWDDQLSPSEISQWRNIAKQFNNSPKISMSRSFGPRESRYKLLAFTDSSKQLYGTVLYLHNLDMERVSFVIAKNRMITSSLGTKTIPTLELQAISFGVEVLLDTFNELTGDACVVPINIVELELFTDSAICLAWLKSYNVDFSKLTGRSVFVKNRLNQITKLCEKHPIKFAFCEGVSNPADCVTRVISYKQLIKSNFLSGEIIDTNNDHSFPVIDIPNPLLEVNSIRQGSVEVETSITDPPLHKTLVPLNKVSSFSKYVRIHCYVFRFINNLKIKLNNKSNERKFPIMRGRDIYPNTLRFVIQIDQREHFPQVVAYLSKSRGCAEMPPILEQLNVFSEDGLLRVKSKFKRWRESTTKFPILLHKDSRLTDLIIKDLHEKTFHGGIYSILSEFRKFYYVPHCFSVVKRVLKECVRCRKVNNRRIKLNQNAYRDFRISPPNIPYRSIFIDYIGPYFIKVNNLKVKVYLLCITCMWSRAINLKICMDLTVASFLRALQLHTMEFGVPELILSDSGSQLTSGFGILADFIKDPQTQEYFSQCGVRSMEFSQYPKGCNMLGGLVESCVKLVKRLIYGSIKNNVLNYFDYEYMIAQVVHLVNRRPLVFKEGLRSSVDLNTFPSAITPEILVRGHELISLNLIPSLQPESDSNDPDWNQTDLPKHVLDSYSKLKKCRGYLVDLYNSEYLSNLFAQATNKKDRYKRVSHQTLQVGDIVLLSEPLQKPVNYPMAIVTETNKNDIGEVTSIVAKKGATGELVERHVASVVPLLSRMEYLRSRDDEPPVHSISGDDDPVRTDVNPVKVRPKREAAERSRKKTSQLISRTLV